MKGWYWHGRRDLRLAELSTRALGSGEIRVAVAYCGICGSDLHEYLDGPQAIPVGRPHALSGRSAPLVIGHEFCGTVVETAPDVAGLRVGERVAIEPAYRCGECAYCQAGQYNLCEAMGFVGLMGDGGMAEQAVVPAYMAHALPVGVSFEQAALAEPAAVALHAVRRSGLRRGDDCAIFGLGTIGQMLVMMARQHGAGRIIAVDVAPARLEMAARLGATHVIDAGAPGAADVGEAVRGLAGGLGVPVAFEAACSAATFSAALHALRKGGEMVLVGLMPQATLDAFDVVNRELRITASVGYRNLYPALLAMMAAGELDAARVVTRTVPLEAACSEGFEALAASRDDIKILVRPTAPSAPAGQVGDA